MKNLNKNQIIIFAIAIMLISAGYLNFTTNNVDENILSSTSSISINDMEKQAAIGDARLVSNNSVIEETNNISNITSNDKLESEYKNTNKDDNEKEDETEKMVETVSKETLEYFSSSKLKRDTMYSQMLETYEKILENPNIAIDQKNISQTEIKNINDTKNKIMICENLIKTKGIEDCIMFVNDMSISIVIRADKLEKDQIAQIQNIVTREMKINIDDIHISNK